MLRICVDLACAMCVLGTLNDENNITRCLLVAVRFPFE